MTQRNNGVSNIVKEKVGEEMFFGMVRSEYNRNRMPITTYALNVRGQGKKVVRIVEAVQQPAMARHIHFVEGFPKHIHKALVDELIHIGQWSHDDLADALSLFFHSQIRIRPAQHSSHPWKTPHRITQRSTARLNPAAVGHVGWKTRQSGAEIDAGDGTSRKDPFLAQRGNVESIDIAKLNK